MTVRSPFLTAAGADWVDGTAVGDWIAKQLGPFGPSVVHAVPRGYADYAVAPITADDDGEPFETLRSLQPLLDRLDAFTGNQLVCTAIWEGWGWFYETGTTPRPNGGVYWDQDGPRPSAEELERARAQARREVAEAMVEFPDVTPLELPARRYYTWTGPLQSATAFREWLHSPPSLIWPTDRAWFIGIPIHTAEIAVGGSVAMIDAIISDPAIDARRVSTDYELDIDD